MLTSPRAQLLEDFNTARFFNLGTASVIQAESRPQSHFNHPVRLC
jgi:hypothetical protein